ncbi:hypothetical protein LINPERHAP2_LOCUS23674 [Linum perenne]
MTLECDRLGDGDLPLMLCSSAQARRLAAAQARRFAASQARRSALRFSAVHAADSPSITFSETNNLGSSVLVPSITMAESAPREQVAAMLISVQCSLLFCSIMQICLIFGEMQGQTVLLWELVGVGASVASVGVGAGCSSLGICLMLYWVVLMLGRDIGRELVSCTAWKKSLSVLIGSLLY